MENELFSFRKNAILDGLCEEWDNMWGACHGDKEKLVRLALMQQSIPYFASYCYNGKGLSKEYIEDTFKELVKGHIFNDCDMVEGFSYAMYVNARKGFTIGLNVAHIMWCKDIEITIEKTKCTSLYISNKSDVRVSLEGFNAVTIYLFDESRVTIERCDETSRVTILRYGSKCKADTDKSSFRGIIKTFQKELRL